MSAITVDIKGLDGIGERIRNATAKKLTEVSAEMEESMRQMVLKAKQDAPKDMGRLAGAISYKKISDLHFEMVCQVSYAPYVEFGTRGNYRAIPGIDASEFMGKGKGDYFDFLNAILDWVKRKGIGFENFAITNEARKRFGQSPIKKKDRLLDVAERIAWSILKKGIKPHPFFFKQLDEEKPQLLSRLRAIL